MCENGTNYVGLRIPDERRGLEVNEKESSASNNVSTLLINTVVTGDSSSVSQKVRDLSSAQSFERRVRMDTECRVLLDLRRRSRRFLSAVVSRASV